ncbi:hypothetical protein PMAYCL1PPCAC_27332, partial [Pristionchus mayeri]
VCRNKSFRTNDTTTCEGDYCMTYGNEYDRDQKCLSGKAIEYMNGRCGLIDGRQPSAFCVCDSDFCSDTAQLIPKRDGNLTCGEGRNCSACVIGSDSGEITPQFCHRQWFSDVHDILRPTSCARFAYQVYAYEHCLCDTGDNCAESLIREQDHAKSETVTCYSYLDRNLTCQGNRCFVQRKNATERVYSGCITNNETLYPGQFPNGYLKLMLNEFIICNSSYCNLDWDSALDNANVTTTTSSASTSDTAAPSKLTLFDYEYTKMF